MRCAKCRYWMLRVGELRRDGCSYQVFECCHCGGSVERLSHTCDHARACNKGKGKCRCLDCGHQWKEVAA